MECSAPLRWSDMAVVLVYEWRVEKYSPSRCRDHSQTSLTSDDSVARLSGAGLLSACGRVTSGIAVRRGTAAGGVGDVGDEQQKVQQRTPAPRSHSLLPTHHTNRQHAHSSGERGCIGRVRGARHSPALRRFEHRSSAGSDTERCCRRCGSSHIHHRPPLFAAHAQVARRTRECVCEVRTL
jgi:hypothetical protein